MSLVRFPGMIAVSALLFSAAGFLGSVYTALTLLLIIVAGAGIAACGAVTLWRRLAHDRLSPAVAAAGSALVAIRAVPSSLRDFAGYSSASSATPSISMIASPATIASPLTRSKSPESVALSFTDRITGAAGVASV